MKRIFVILTLALAVLSIQCASAGKLIPITQEDITFIATSDCHYDSPVNLDRNQRNRTTVMAMNAITQVSWPAALGGEKIQSPRGVVVLGDCIDDGDMMADGVNQTEKQYLYFVGDFGLDGTDALLKYPVFETWGNHDGPPDYAVKYGFSFQAKLKERNRLRLEKKLISNISENGLHYSWNWGDVHFVSLGIYPADKQREGVRYNPVWHDPQMALSFLKEDLAKNVGSSGRPVVLMAHMGFDTDWWVLADWVDFYNAVKPYNVIVYMYGHSGTGTREWAPEGETKKLFCINTGQTENGFFVVQIKGKQLRYGYRTGGEWKWTGVRNILRPIATAIQNPVERTSPTAPLSH